MLSAKGALDPVKNALSTDRIPMVDLPISDEALGTLLEQVDAVLVTHTHRDHWDSRAQQLLPKNKLILCQPTDLETIRNQHFQHVQLFDQFVSNGVTFIRTDGQHGTGDVGRQMGTVSGVVMQYGDESIYVAGDTIWCEPVERVLQMYRPRWIVLNAGAAQFLQGDPITMTSEDVIKVSQQAPWAMVIVVHMEVVNHCSLTRSALKQQLLQAGLDQRVLVPADGQIISLS